LQQPATALEERFLAHKWERVTKRLRVFELLCILAGFTAVLIHAGFTEVSTRASVEIRWIEFVSLAALSVSRGLRFLLTRRLFGTTSAFQEASLASPICWAVGMLLLAQTEPDTFVRLKHVWTPSILALITVLRALTACRALATRTRNSAILLVGSFAVVITLGTLLLKLPACRAAGPNGTAISDTPWDVALFTATSASCVTGLILEPTGSYWSPVGHAVIFALFQIGGLGILTFGAFIAVLSGRRGLQFREARTLRDMLDADSVQNSRRLLVTILLVTFSIEVLGAVSIVGLWDHLPRERQIWNAVFHAVSAFCNAGFSLQDDGFLHQGREWQVWGPISWLIILGGLGFPVIQDVWLRAGWELKRRSRRQLLHPLAVAPRLSLHSRLVLCATGGLLLFGSVTWFFLESLEASPGGSIVKRIADAWFQSVTFRTAGFNTVDHANMHPASKLLGIFLMFVGAAPGSTGGGVKTIVFAVALLNLRAVFLGRDRVEVFGRTVPTRQVARSLAMIAAGLFIVMATAGLLVIFERQPERFVDHLFEATSAFATVGVSAGITSELTLPSRLLICVVMFLGRVGPITMLLAMATPGDPLRFSYPEERVSLG
jgi:trk system potassium uptake protein TrkH